MSKPPLILSLGFFLSNVQPLRTENFRASTSAGALHFCLGNAWCRRVCWSADSTDSVTWVRNKPLSSAGKPNQSRPCSTCLVTVKLFFSLQDEVGTEELVIISISKGLWHSYMLRVRDPCRGQSRLWSFLVYVFEEDTSMGVGVNGFFREVRDYTASLLFPRSLAEMGSDVAFRSNHSKLTFAIAKLFI